MFEADKTFINGKIYTMEKEGDIVSALVVYDGQIIFAGNDEEAKKIPTREMIDLQGKTVLPGFIDTHCHMAEAVEATVKVRLDEINSIEEGLERLRAALKDVKEGEWLYGYQISSSSLVENRLPDRHDLDRVSKEVPIYISSSCLHNFMCNSKVLELAGIKKGLQCEGIELMDVDEDGEPTGIFREHKMLRLINQVRPAIIGDIQKQKQAMYDTLFQLSHLGLTTLHTYDGFTESELDQVYIYQQLEQEDRLPMRMVINRQVGVDNEIGVISGLGNDKVKYGAVKFFADGNFAERSAVLLEEYSDRHGWKGICSRTKEKFKEEIKRAYDKGNDIAIHVIGDGSLDIVLDILEEIYNPNQHTQFRLIHMSLSNPDQWERLKRLPVVVDSQAVFMPSLGHISEARLGAERAQFVEPFHSLEECGIKITLGSDGPIGTMNPFEGIRYACLRESEFGGKVFLPKERVSVYSAVAMYTKNAAYCGHEEEKKGTLAEGKLADFIVIDQDIFSIPIEKISDTKVLSTYMGGKAVY